MSTTHLARAETSDLPDVERVAALVRTAYELSPIVDPFEEVNETPDGTTVMLALNHTAESLITEMRRTRRHLPGVFRQYVEQWSESVGMLNQACTAITGSDDWDRFAAEIWRAYYEVEEGAAIDV